MSSRSSSVARRRLPPHRSFSPRALAVGFKGSVIQPDGCGLLEVAVHGIPSVKVGEEVVGEARSVHLDATLEQLVP